VIAAALPSGAQTAAADAPAADTGLLELGGRLSSVAGDPGRFQRLRDLRSGPAGDRMVVLAVEDITERRRVEQARPGERR
jgi:hypothetical protein